MLPARGAGAFWRIWALLLFHLTVSQARAADGEGLRAVLVDQGFENVAVHRLSGEMRVEFENRVFRDELRALGRVAALAAEHADPAEAVVLVPHSRGVPILAVRASAEDWGAYLSGRIATDDMRRRIHVLTPSDLSPAPSQQRHNASFRRVDLRLRPLFDFELGIADDPFRSSTRIAAEAVTSPFRGGLLTAQLVVRVDEHLAHSRRRVAPGRTTLSWGGALFAGTSGTFSGGILPGNRYGLAGEIGGLSRSGRIELRAGGDWTGLLEFAEHTIFYTGLDAWSAFARLTVRPEGIDVEPSATVARFLEGDLGVRLDVDRRFHETRVGFFAVRTHVDTVLGLTLSLPLPVRSWTRPAPVRFVTVPAFPFEYRDSLNEVGMRASLVDDLDAFRKGLTPTFLRHHLADLRRGLP